MEGSTNVEKASEKARATDSGETAKEAEDSMQNDTAGDRRREAGKTTSRPHHNEAEQANSEIAFETEQKTEGGIEEVFEIHVGTGSEQAKANNWIYIPNEDLFKFAIEEAKLQLGRVRRELASPLAFDSTASFARSFLALSLIPLIPSTPKTFHSSCLAEWWLLRQPQQLLHRR